jgi:hypothetical protein
MIDEDPFPWPPCDELELDGPCFVGEVPTKNTQFLTREYLNAAKDGEYSGLLVWSYRAGDEYSNFNRAKRALKRWCANS